MKKEKLIYSKNCYYVIVFKAEVFNMEYIKIKLFELFLYQPPCYANHFVNNLENKRKRVTLCVYEIANLREGPKRSYGRLKQCSVTNKSI